MGTTSWIIENWFTLIQTTGIVGSLAITGWSFRIDAKVRRVQNLITITAHHREIWSVIYKRPELKRIIDPKANITNNPISETERLFTRSLFLHLAATFQASRTGMFSEPEGLGSDIGAFIRLPIPREVWLKWKTKQDHDFVRFVEGFT